MTTKSDQEEYAVEVHESAELALFDSDPGQALSQMEHLVKSFAAKIKGPDFISIIDGKEYPKVTWWTTIGAPLGLFPVTDWSRRMDDRPGEVAWEARVSIMKDGHVISTAEMMCSDKEGYWRDGEFKPKWNGETGEYAIRSMAVSRAIGKAYRQALSFLALFAGLNPVAAEEIVKGAVNFGSDAPKAAGDEFLDLDAPLGFGKHKETPIRKVERGYLEWMVDNATKGKWAAKARKIIDALDKENGVGQPEEGQAKTTKGKSPELLIFTRQLDVQVLGMILEVRYDKKHLDELDRIEQEDLLAWFQEEIKVRPDFNESGNLGVHILEAHWPEGSYRTLAPDDMALFGQLLTRHLQIIKARAKDEKQARIIVTGWEMTEKVKLPTATINELDALINGLNGPAK